MEKWIKSKGSFKTVLEVDGVECAHAGLLKWWRTDLVFKKGDEVYAELKKDSYWKWNLSLLKHGECLLNFKAKFFGKIEVHAPNGDVWKLMKKGGSDNQLILLNSQGEEVLCLEKQGKWWKNRPYKVVAENTEQLPMQDEILPLVLAASIGIFNQRAAWIFPIVFGLQAILRIVFEE